MEIEHYSELALRTDLSPEQYAASMEVISELENATTLSRLFEKISEVSAVADALKRTVFYLSKKEVINFPQKVISMTDLATFKSRISEPEMMRLFHAALGAFTEACELIETLDDYLFDIKDTNEPLDVPNIVVELGDINWYVNGVGALAARTLFPEATPAKILLMNITKLRKRYPDKFSGEKAIGRDELEERKIFAGIKRERSADENGPFDIFISSKQEFEKFLISHDLAPIHELPEVPDGFVFRVQYQYVPEGTKIMEILVVDPNAKSEDLVNGLS